MSKTERPDQTGDLPAAAPAPHVSGEAGPAGGTLPAELTQQLAAYGLGPHEQTALLDLRRERGEPDLLPARVVRVERNGYRVQTSGGEPEEAVLPAGQRHRGLDVPVIGDWVAVQPAPAGTPLRLAGVLPRRSLLIRAVERGRRVEPQVLAANVDTAFIVTSPDEEWDTAQLGRYVQAVRLAGVQPVILLNKADLTDDPQWYAQALAEHGLDVPLLPVQAQGGAGLAALAPYLQPGQTAALIGPSGVGKSTLTNRLLGQEAAQVGSRSAANQEGRHTTTWRTLYRLPAGEVSGGGLLIDNPGLRDIAVWDERGEAFWRIEELAAECRFTRCTHTSEPGCAVRAAVLRGELDPDLLTEYQERAGAGGASAKQRGRSGSKGGPASRTSPKRQGQSRTR